MPQELDNGYFCDHCGGSVLFDEKEAKHFPFCSDECYNNYYKELYLEETGEHYE